MNTKYLLLILAVLVVGILLFVNLNNKRALEGGVGVDPITHASMILAVDGKIIYVDPVAEDESLFAGKPDPDIVLLTDIHGDHLDVNTLTAVSRSHTLIIASMAVADMLPATVPGTLLVMRNGQSTTELGLSIEAIPMYNLPESPDNYHIKGRGNGYLVEGALERVYISGDTSGTAEMRSLQDIDVAFVAMNFPYTMSVEEAAEAVLEFKPKKVYPYHYRIPEGFSDVERFKELVNTGNPDIEVVQLDWYQN